MSSTARAQYALMVALTITLALLPPGAALPSPMDGDKDSFPLSAGPLGASALLRLRGGFGRKAAQYEFSDQDNEAFLTAGKLMRHVSIGFYVHSAVEGVLIAWDLAHGAGGWLSLFDVMDELTYAFLIRGCSQCMYDIATTSGSDIQTLLSSIDMQSRLWHHMRVPLAVKTAILLSSLFAAFLPRQAARVQRAVEGPLGGVARLLAPPAEAGLSVVGAALGASQRALAAALAGADAKVQRLMGKPCGVGIMVEAGKDGLQVAGFGRPVTVLRTQSLKSGWDPQGVMVGDVILSVGEEFMNGRVAAYVEEHLRGPIGSSVEVRFMRRHADRSQGGQYIARLLRDK